MTQTAVINVTEQGGFREDFIKKSILELSMEYEYVLARQVRQSNEAYSKAGSMEIASELKHIMVTFGNVNNLVWLVL